MRIAVMGTGAVGGYFGAKLAAAGDDVVFIARQRHLPGLRRNGLRIESFNGDLHVRNGLFTDSPADAGVVGRLQRRGAVERPGIIPPALPGRARCAAGVSGALRRDVPLA